MIQKQEWKNFTCVLLVPLSLSLPPSPQEETWTSFTSLADYND